MPETSSTRSRAAPDCLRLNPTQQRGRPWSSRTPCCRTLCPTCVWCSSSWPSGIGCDLSGRWPWPLGEPGAWWRPGAPAAARSARPDDQGDGHGYRRNGWAGGDLPAQSKFRQRPRGCRSMSHPCRTGCPVGRHPAGRSRRQDTLRPARAGGGGLEWATDWAVADFWPGRELNGPSSGYRILSGTIVGATGHSVQVELDGCPAAARRLTCALTTASAGEHHNAGLDFRPFNNARVLVAVAAGPTRTAVVPARFAKGPPSSRLRPLSSTPPSRSSAGPPSNCARPSAGKDACWYSKAR